MTITKKLSDIVNTTYDSNKTLKPIEFTCGLNDDIEIETGVCNPNEWEHVILVTKYDDFDVMLAYDDNIERGTIYIGHWNDGVVE